MVIDKEYQLKVETDSSTPVEYTSSEESVAKIDDSGKITTLSEGETEITASIGEYVYDKFTLNVHTEEIHLTSIKLDQTKIEFDKTTITNSSGFIENEMTPKEIEVSIICEPDNTTDDLSFICVSQNNDMVSARAALDENGEWKVIAKGSTYDVGETKIIVKEESNPSINCELTVYSYGINAVEYHKNLRNGDTFQTEYKTYFRDSDEIVTSKSYAVTWQDVYEDDRLPGNPVAKVDQNGLITGVDNGACTVTLTVETNKGKKYTTKFSITCHVRILGVKAIKDIIELKPKDVFTVANNLEFIPKNAEGYRIVSTIIEDNNPCVSLGDANGFFLKAEKPGTAKITVTIGVDSETYSASFEVKVLCDHISTEGHEGKDPTCTEMGYLPYQVCTECGVVIYDGKEYNSFDEIEKDRLLPINENNHINLQDYEATSSTCVTQGHLGYTKCEDCGKVEYSGKWYDSFDDIPEDELLPLTDHTGGTATCSKKAICDVCKKEYGEYDSSKHESTTVYQAVASTCLVHGHEEYEMCDECGTIISGSDALLPLADHTGGTATCSKKAICSVCNQEYGNYDNTKHTNIQSYEAIESTCETQGHSAYTKCEDCGTIISGSDALLPLASHTGGTATCTEKAICDVCGQEYGDYDSTNHTNLQNYEAISSTCITQGHSAYTKCEDCGTIISGSDTLLPLLDHTGGTATCTKKAVCDVCGQEYGDFDSTNHINTQSYSATESTCSVHGHNAYTKCEDCGTIISGSDELLPLADHTGGTATCSKKAVCDVCGQEYGDFDNTNHINKEIRNKIDPTTINEGYTGDLYCKDCNTLLEKGTTIAKLEIPVYEVLEGIGENYTKHTEDIAIFRISGDISLFDKVFIDGNLIDPSNYTVTSGSTVITFNNNFMDTLSIGNHILKVTYRDGGEVEIPFTVNEKEKVKENNSLSAFVASINTGGDFMNTHKVKIILEILIGIAIVLIVLIRKNKCIIKKGKRYAPRKRK